MHSKLVFLLSIRSLWIQKTSQDDHCTHHRARGLHTDLTGSKKEGNLSRPSPQVDTRCLQETASFCKQSSSNCTSSFRWLKRWILVFGVENPQPTWCCAFSIDQCSYSQVGIPRKNSRECDLEEPRWKDPLFGDFVQSVSPPAFCVRDFWSAHRCKGSP